MSKRFIGRKHTDEAKAKISAGLLKFNSGPGGGGRRFPDAQVFVENSTYDRGHLKARILKQNLIPYECLECGLTDKWNGKEIVLRLDHINGTHNDHRIENFRFLCPNCDSQQKTYSGRNAPYKKNRDKV